MPRPAVRGPAHAFLSSSSWKKHSTTSASVQPSAKPARVGTSEQHSSAGSRGLGAPAAAPASARPWHTQPGWHSLPAAAIQENVPGKGFLAWMGRLCLACSNEHGWELAGRKKQAAAFFGSAAGNREATWAVSQLKYPI